MDDRLVKLRKFRFVEQRGFQTFFENWKAKNLARETAMREPGKSSHIEQYDNDTLDETRDDEVSDDETSDDDEDSKFSHLWKEEQLSGFLKQESFRHEDIFKWVIYQERLALYVSIIKTANEYLEDCKQRLLHYVLGEFYINRHPSPSVVLNRSR